MPVQVEEVEEVEALGGSLHVTDSGARGLSRSLHACAQPIISVIIIIITELYGFCSRE